MKLYVRDFPYAYVIIFLMCNKMWMYVRTYIVMLHEVHSVSNVMQPSKFIVFNHSQVWGFGNEKMWSL